MDDIRVYDTAISGDQVRADMGGEVPVDPAAAGLQLHLDMENVSGQTVINLGAAPVDGTLGADATVAADDPTPAGFNGGAIDFNRATGDYLDLGSDNAIFTGESDLTWETWVKVETLPTGAERAILFQIGNPANFERADIFIESDGSVSFGNYGAEPSAVADVNLVPGQWYHVAAVHTNGANSTQMYINGVASGPAVTQTIDITSGPASIGGPKVIGGNSVYFEGQMADARIYAKALSAAEIQADMVTPPSAAEPGLVLAYPMNGSDGSTLTEMVRGADATYISSAVPATPTVVATNPLVVAEDSVLHGRLEVADIDSDTGFSFGIDYQPMNGQVSIDPETGEWTYTPNSEFSGIDSFEVSVRSGDDGYTTKTIDVTVLNINDAPEITGLDGDTVAYVQG